MFRFDCFLSFLTPNSYLIIGGRRAPHKNISEVCFQAVLVLLFVDSFYLIPNVNISQTFTATVYVSTVDRLQGGLLDASICGRMECWISESKTCFSSPKLRAFEKTTCGNHKWCVRGHCVANAAAPSTKGKQYLRY